MTRYLQNLVFRTANDPPILRPRLPVQFEPNTYALAQVNAAFQIVDDSDQFNGVFRGLTAIDPETPPRVTVHDEPRVPDDNSRVALELPGTRRSTRFEVPSLAASTRREEHNSRHSSAESSDVLNRVDTKVPSRAPREDHVGDLTPSEAVHSLAPKPEFGEEQLVDSTPLQSLTAEKTPARTHNLMSIPIKSRDEVKYNPPTNVPPELPRAPDAKSRPFSASDASVQRRGRTTSRSDTAAPARQRKLVEEFVNDHAIQRGSAATLGHQSLSGELTRKSVEPLKFPVRHQLGQIEQIVPKVANDREAPQTIQVSIGRIEIKAVSADARRQQPRCDRPAVMSLDDYLSRYAAGSAL